MLEFKNGITIDLPKKNKKKHFIEHKPELFV